MLLKYNNKPLSTLLTLAVSCLIMSCGSENQVDTDQPDGSTSIEMMPESPETNKNSNPKLDKNSDTEKASDSNNDINLSNDTPIISAVYLAQTHVLKPDSPNFMLVADRSAFVKVELHHAQDTAAPNVTVKRGKENDVELSLSGPLYLPTAPVNPAGKIEIHSKNNSFTGLLPKSWIQPGLELVIEVDSVEQWRGKIKVGAKNPMIMTMIDTHFFKYTDKKVYADGWDSELNMKLPISSLDIRRAQGTTFKQLVIPSRAKKGPVRVSSKEEYKTLTGIDFDGEQAAAGKWVGALKQAAGRGSRWNFLAINIFGVRAGGQSSDFGVVLGAGQHGILLHEIGHALSLRHWGQVSTYPYRGNMLGISAPTSQVHAGPVWAFDLSKQAFIQPFQEKYSGPVFTVDPMQGGGNFWDSDEYLYRHFSDYSIKKMQSWLSKFAYHWDQENNQWLLWKHSDQAYQVVKKKAYGEFNYGLHLPNSPSDQVISIMASISGVHDKGMDKNGLEHINMVYTPIGPYSSGLIPTFDPRLTSDRDAMREFNYCPEEGCDLSFRVIQGGAEYYYAIAQSFTSSLLNVESAAPLLATKALNIPADQGEVTLVELLATPDININGSVINARILGRWEKTIN